MTCASCVATIENALRAVPGVGSATVGLLSEQAEVRFDPTCVTPEALLQCIEDTGFEASKLDSSEENTVTLRIEGMTCSSCVHTIEVGLPSRRRARKLSSSPC